MIALKMMGAALVALLMAGAPPLAARAQALADAPQLAAPGAYATGVMRLDLTHPRQPQLSGTGAGFTPQDRVLPLTIWYPAKAPSGAAHAHYQDHLPGPTTEGSKVGSAWAGAAPIRNQRFPLVIFSHGFSNWATGFSNLAEGLASHGYVVVAIDHHDAEPSKTTPQAAAFAETVISRSADQRFVIASLAGDVHKGPLSDTYDPGRMALIGYSMGGFGALETAGAALDKGSNLAKAMSGAAIPAGETDASPPPGLKALVLMAPWGGGTSLRAWSPQDLSHVAAPTLVIDGDQDDVADYKDGVSWIYDNLVHADRYKLVFQNARHNIAGDGVSAEHRDDFKAIERLEEPVWRRDRLLAINRHFITAFLDMTLKHDGAAATYLSVPTVEASAGAWPLPPSASVGGQYAAPTDAASKTYWPGFQRRWALGLELKHDTAQGPSAPR
jgi:dienelactone hydrolase